MIKDFVDYNLAITELVLMEKQECRFCDSKDTLKIANEKDPRQVFFICHKHYEESGLKKLLELELLKDKPLQRLNQALRNAVEECEEKGLRKSR